MAQLMTWLTNKAVTLSWVVPCLCLLATGAADASEPDLAREQRLADQIIDAILDGEPVWLDDAAAQRRFLGIYMPADAEAQGTVILMHGRGMHPDWADTVGPLRVSLTERGWNTLSIQMPVLPKDTRYYDYVPIFPASFSRIRSAIAFARANGAQRVVLFAHSCSVHMSMAYVRAHGDGDFDAYIGAGMGATDYRQPMRAPFAFERLSVPVLDVYGQNEYRAVIKGAPGRLAAFAGRHPSSRQLVVPGADHYFKGAEEALDEAVGDWLEAINW